MPQEACWLSGATRELPHGVDVCCSVGGQARDQSLLNISCMCRFGPYFVSPVIAGLQPDLTPYLAGTDSIGAIETAKDFMVAGTAPDSLLGMCESMWRPDMVGLMVPRY